MLPSPPWCEELLTAIRAAAQPTRQPDSDGYNAAVTDDVIDRAAGFLRALAPCTARPHFHFGPEGVLRLDFAAVAVDFLADGRRVITRTPPFEALRRLLAPQAYAEALMVDLQGLRGLLWMFPVFDTYGRVASRRFELLDTFTTPCHGLLVAKPRAVADIEAFVAEWTTYRTAEQAGARPVILEPRHWG